MTKHHEKPGSPGDILDHSGVKGMKWGVRKEVVPVGRAVAKPLTPGTPEFQQVIERLTRTDHPQVLMPGLGGGPPSLPRAPRSGSGKIEPGEHQPKADKHGLTRNQKMLIAFGAATAAAGGYYAYKHYVGGTMPGLDLKTIKQEERALAGMNLPSHWDVSGLKNGPLSTSKLGDLAGGHFNARLLDQENLVINTSRGYADILPKGGFSNPFAAEQHASVTRVLEEMRDKFPAVRNMNVEVIPMSKVTGLESSTAHMCVMSMRAGEARVMYNDLMDAPSPATIKQNIGFLPGLGKKDYVAYHEMGHLLSVAHGELPPSLDLLTGEAGPGAMARWQRAEPLLHKRMFAKHGFSFKELSKLSRYAATEPAEAMAELSGHYFQPDMRKRLTPDQLRRAEAMFNEMGGLTG